MNTRCTPALVLLVSLVMAACGSGTTGATTTVGVETPTTSTVTGGADTTTTLGANADSTTSMPAVTTTADEAVNVDDIPAECLAVISQLLQAFEPAVKDIDWETATIDDHISVMMSMASVSIDDTSGCENVNLDITDEEGTALFLAVAQQEAPGAVTYFKAILEINAALGGREATGDCKTDIGIFEDIVAGGVPFVDLSLPEQYLVLNLMSSIGYCSLQTQGELRFRPEVEEFLEGSPF